MQKDEMNGRALYCSSFLFVNKKGGQNPFGNRLMNKGRRTMDCSSYIIFTSRIAITAAIQLRTRIGSATA
ncbi:hypothetical protein HMPREF9372_1437 [Sporosarcina newyorkensis 2681]|uniref:Uncharacterized protein n=1 Tax=Sporosarcina newyorkensis 2681 TaxID=1027292 RepID=F9DRK7_9BACL|nr:hypothetical protein HMPREF9372_1437 [Sporosarcina newyorkensis 2681]